MEVHLQAFAGSVRDTSRRWIATRPLIDVASQGTTASDAQRCLQEAVELWFESCVERGVLEQALRETIVLIPPFSQAERNRRQLARATRNTPAKAGGTT